MDSTGATKPTFLWRGILILLPLLLLAGAGLYSLRQDRILAEVEARERCQSLAGNYAATISSGLLTRMERVAATQLFSGKIVLDAQANLFSIDGSLKRASIPQDPLPQPLPETELEGGVAGAWQKARHAEYAVVNNSAHIPVIDLWKLFLFRATLQMPPPVAFLAPARYDLGLLLADDNERYAADELFSKAEGDLVQCRRKDFTNMASPCHP
jgi:hypothetical protein